jgi:hypothetical protein
MVNKKRFDMGMIRTGREEWDPGVTSSDLENDPFDRMNIELKRSLRILFAQEAARRDMKKRDLANEIFAFYFTHKNTIIS